MDNKSATIYANKQKPHFNKQYGNVNNRHGDVNNIQGNVNNHQFQKFIKNNQQKVYKRVSEFNDKLVDKNGKYNIKNFASDKYKNFSNKFKNPANRKIIKLLPAILLSITVLASKNIHVLNSLYKTYDIASKILPKSDSNVFGKTVEIIKIYIDVIKELKIFDRFDVVISTVVFFCEEIPNIYYNINNIINMSKNESQILVYKKIMNNVNRVNHEIIEKPLEEERRKQELIKKNENKKKHEQERQDEIRELKELKRELRELAKTKSNKKTSNKKTSNKDKNISWDDPSYQEEMDYTKIPVFN